MGFGDVLGKINPLNWGKSAKGSDWGEFGGEDVSINLDPPVSLEEGARSGQVDMNSTVTFGMDKNGALSGVTAPNKTPRKKL